MNNKQPVALLINDIHVSKDNITEFQDNWNEAIQICIDNEIGDIIVGGDLWLSRSAQTLDVLMAVRQAIIKATSNEIYVTIAEGNHCKVDQESVLGYSHIFSEYPNVEVVDHYSAIDIGENTVLYIMSYFPESGSFISLLNQLIENDLDTTKCNVLYIHEGIKGGLATPSEKELPTKIFQPFSSVLVGHYHDRKKIKDTNIEYIGSSRQHNFGEDEMKGYTILFDNGESQFIQNKANTRYKTLVMGLDELKENGVPKLSGDIPYKLKLCVQCSSAETSSIDKKQLIEMGCTKVEIQTDDNEEQSVAAHSLEHRFDKSGIKDEYTSFCADKGISNVKMGLQYLDKIK